jgi:diacylglycerol kinase (ATP)
MIRALALAGPRATEQQVGSFRNPQVQLKVLHSSTAEEVSRTLATERPEIILIFGGDGTVNVHLNQLANMGIPVLVIPCGSGNDLARVAGTDSIDTARGTWFDYLSNKRTVQPTDLGRICSPKLAQPRYLSCCANIGLDAEAARRTDGMPDWAKSHGGYFVGGLMALAGYEPQMMTIRSSEREHVEPGWFVSISNTPTFGGGLKIAPHASVTDGQLDVTFVGSNVFTRAQLARHFPKILTGKHVGIRGLSLFPTKTISIETERASPVYADGERITETPCEIDVAPGALQLVTAPMRIGVL